MRCPHSESAAAAVSPSASALPPSSIPGPGSMPVVGWRGNALQFFSNPVHHMVGLHRRYGPLVRLASGPNRPIFFSSPRRDVATYFALGAELVRDVGNDLETFHNASPPGPDDPVYRRLATNLFFLNGERHRQQKGLMRPWFDRKNLQRYHAGMIGVVERMLAGWDGRRELDVAEEMSQVTLEISSKMLYGIDAKRGERHLAGRMAEMIKALFSPLSMIPINLPGTPLHRLLRLMRSIEQDLLAEIEAKRRESYRGEDILTAMVRVHDEDSSQMSADELIGEAFTIFFAGHDTASKALVWTLFLIAQHPEVAAELHAELERELGGAAPDYEQVFRLPVLDRIIKESLRILPPAVVFARKAVRPTELGGFEIPEGSEILFSPYVIHKDPAIYEHPNRFSPDRWLGIKPKTYEYMPFGYGARTCLGASFGMMQLRLIIAMIVQRFRLASIDGTRLDLETSVVIGPKKGLRMRLSPQDRRFEDSPAHITGYVREMVDLD